MYAKWHVIITGRDGTIHTDAHLTGTYEWVEHWAECSLAADGIATITRRCSTMLTRKDFRAIAQTLRERGDREAALKEAQNMALFCAKSNPRFDVHRFMLACGFVRLEK